MADQRLQSPSSGDVFERYRCGEITLDEAVAELRRTKGRFPWRQVLTDPFYVVGWLITRVLFCPFGKHATYFDPLMRVPFYGNEMGHAVCLACGVVILDPRPNRLRGADRRPRIEPRGDLERARRSTGAPGTRFVIGRLVGPVGLRGKEGT